MTHTLVIEPGYLWGSDGYCEDCYDPDFSEGSWIGCEGIYNATVQEIDDWFADHVSRSDS